MFPQKPLPKVERIELIFGAWNTVDRHWNLVVLPDGYTQDELRQFAADVNELKERLTRIDPPFDRMRSAINIFRVDVASPESWNSKKINDWHAIKEKEAEAAHDEQEKRRIIREQHCSIPALRTAFGSRLCRNNILRLMGGDASLVKQTVQSEPRLWGTHLGRANGHPRADALLVVVNTEKYYAGSAGDGVAWTSRYFGWPDTAIHELGHQAFALEDEYHFLNEISENKRYSGVEPEGLNATTKSRPTKRPWSDLLTPGVNLPTTVANKDCKKLTTKQQLLDGDFGILDPKDENSVGAFEGAGRYLCGLYRPMRNCRMRHDKDDFCSVCEQVIVERLGKHMFGNAKTKPEQPVDLATDIVTFEASEPRSPFDEPKFVAYDFGSGGYAIYPCSRFFEKSLLTPRPVRGYISAFWTSLVLTHIQKEPHLLATQLVSGQAALYRIAADGSGLTRVWGAEVVYPTVPQPFGLLQVVPFTANDQPHYLEYDFVSGVATIKRIDLDNPDAVTVRTVPWGQGAITFAPFTLVNDPRTHFVSYNVTNGNLGFERFDGDDLTIVWGSSSALRPGWTNCMPLTLSDGSRCLLLYSPLKADLQMYLIRSDGQGIDYVYSDKTIGPGAFVFAAFARQEAYGSQTYYLRLRLPLLPGQQAKVAAFYCG